MSTASVYFSIQDLADLLGLNHKAIRALIRKGELIAYKIGGVYRISQCQLDDYLALHQTGKQPEPEPACKPNKPIKKGRWFS